MKVRFSSKIQFVSGLNSSPDQYIHQHEMEQLAKLKEKVCENCVPIMGIMHLQTYECRWPQMRKSARNLRLHTKKL